MCLLSRAACLMFTRTFIARVYCLVGAKDEHDRQQQLDDIDISNGGEDARMWNVYMLLNARTDMSHLMVENSMWRVTS